MRGLQLKGHNEKNILPIRPTPLRFYGTGGVTTATPGDAHHSYFGFVGYARGYVKGVGRLSISTLKHPRQSSAGKRDTADFKIHL